jgi:hypothetical protein
MDDYNVVYCENDKCRVLIFENKIEIEGGEVDNNCPGCGQFGRIKGQQP